jgi:hypothetical protein
MLVPQHPILVMMSQKSFSVIFSSKEKKTKKAKQRKENTTKYPKFKCSAVSVHLSA